MDDIDVVHPNKNIERKKGNNDKRGNTTISHKKPGKGEKRKPKKDVVTRIPGVEPGAVERAVTPKK